MKTKKVLVIISEGFEETEAVAIIDILRRAKLDVRVAGLSAREIVGAHKIKILTDTTLGEKDEDFDAVVFPGGFLSAESLSKSEDVKTLIKDMYNKGRIVAAICASPALVLAPTGILDNKKATCYPGMEGRFPDSIQYSDEPVVIDGNVVTSRGPGTALLFGIRIVELLKGREIADSVKKKVLL